MMFLSRGLKKLPKNWAGSTAVRYRKALHCVNLHICTSEWASLSTYVQAAQAFWSSRPCGVGCAN